jgi:protein-S-isoprenylcysteine O-methyltransferase Ste14
MGALLFVAGFLGFWVFIWWLFNKWGFMKEERELLKKYRNRLK